MSIVFTSGVLHARNGGSKFYNLWVKLLREHGYDACIATQDGSYEPWLVEHQPVVSYDQVRKMNAPTIVTGWLPTPGLEALARGRPFYYFDAELKWTLAFRPALEQYMRHDQIAGIATHNRYIQAWYMVTYGIMPLLIHSWSDREIFYPDASARQEGTIGCMVDDPGSEVAYRALQAAFPGQVHPISGDEAQVAEAIRSVDIFAGINPGKDTLWGEGCPRTQEEAMHSGCVVVAFDVLGNREYLLDGWSGVLVERGDVDGLVDVIRGLQERREEKEWLRRNGFEMTRALFSDGGKIELARKWLDL